MTHKKGIGSYPAEDPARGPATGNSDVNPDEDMGSNKPRKSGKDEMADPDRIRRDLERYQDEMAEDAPGTGTPEDRV
jgi:hypothetical protein